MVEVKKEDLSILQKEKEVLGFVSESESVQNSDTKKEKKELNNVLYRGGIPILTLISYMTSNANPFWFSKGFEKRN